MRIQQIEVDRFRIWRNLDLPLVENGLNVVYGPNEAGKSTLMKFVRSVFYGFPQETDPRAEENFAPWSGALKVTNGGNRYRIHRRAQRNDRGTVRITSRQDPEPELQTLLSDISESVFEDIFAVGLKEIQQLATMDSQQVAEHIYGLSMGPSGKSLLHAIQDIEERRAQLLNAENGRLPNLFGSYQRLLRDGHTGNNTREKHSALCHELEDLQHRIDKSRRQQETSQSNLRGYEHLRRCWKPWKRVRDLSAEIEQMPLMNNFSTDVFKQLDDIDREYTQTKASADRAAAEKAQLDKQLERMRVDPDFEKQSTAIRSFVEQTDWLREIDTKIKSSGSSRIQVRQKLDQVIQALGDGWSLERLENIDTSPQAHVRLLKAARDYQSALGRRGRLRKLNAKTSRSTQKRQQDVDERLAALGGESTEQQIQVEQDRLLHIQELTRLRIQDQEMAQRGNIIRTLVSRVDASNSLPPWIDLVFGIFGVIGTILFFTGIYLGTTEGTLAGAAFGFAGLMWWFFRNGLKNHFTEQTQIQLEDLHDQAGEHDDELETVRAHIATLVGDVGQQRQLTSEDEAQLTLQTLQRINDLEKLTRDEEIIAHRRRRLSDLRTRFRSAQQDLSQARQQWCETLRDLGLDETVKVSQAFETWQYVLEASELRHNMNAVAPEVEGYRRTWDSVRDRIAAVAKKLPRTQPNAEQPMEVLSAWRQQLTMLDRDQTQRENVRRESEKKNRELRELQIRLDALDGRRSALLTLAGASDRDDLNQQAEWLDLRASVESDLSRARAELEEIAASEPGMAIMEDDLVRFDAAECERRIHELEQEIQKATRELDGALEKVGRLKHEIQVLEEGRPAVDTDFERGRIAGQIHRSAEEFFALQLAEQVVETMRNRFERGAVSSTLTIASDYMKSLTRGRYKRIWAPLGKHHLCVDDAYDRTFGIHELSGGTREQLFVAIRMALVKEFSQRGIELPMVMDDLFVNFDQDRTEAAVDSLIDYANSGQQVLFFTCHLHVAKMFEDRRVDTLWLPGPRLEDDMPELRSDDFAEPSRPESKNEIEAEWVIADDRRVG